MDYEKQISRTKLIDGKIIRLFHDEVELPDGRKTVREVCEHPGAVVVLPLDGRSIVFVRQYRYAIGRELIELPAGKLEPGEAHAVAAARELREETGMAADEMMYMGYVYPSPGILSEMIHIYFARGLHYVGEAPDADEFVSRVEIPVDTFFEMMLHGEIWDAKSICAIMLAKARGLL